jgi:hypothetical protein
MTLMAMEPAMNWKYRDAPIPSLVIITLTLPKMMDLALFQTCRTDVMASASPTSMKMVYAIAMRFTDAFIPMPSTLIQWQQMMMPPAYFPVPGI